ncbi:hypothetical protein M408DRAFT_233215 [Serendipita vermifera MAFF 305830]|uniref:Uncharacterized protein n=1 Tax=Serendipita vermifera MAFF 305830 TaxID=933852 RepID=A0A0C3AYN7_SERVB|nr:hypothetical protein M408DRAFT_233215 [Serendipita vermifera MAFF 305830]
MASDTQKLIHDAESALHKASEVVEDTVESTKTTLRKADKELTREAGALQSGLESVLGGKSLFWVEQPVDGRRLAGNMAGWGTFGLAVHAWHRGIQRMPVLGAREYLLKRILRSLADLNGVSTTAYRPFMLAFPIWSLLGYYIHHFELRQEEVLGMPIPRLPSTPFLLIPLTRSP